MKIIIEGEVEEIAALVVGLQGRLDMTIEDEPAIKDIAQAIYDRRQGPQEKSDS